MRRLVSIALIAVLAWFVEAEALGDWFRVFYGRPELAERVAVFGPPEACVEGLAEVVRAGAQLIVLNPVFDEERHAEILAAEVIPALVRGA